MLDKFGNQPNIQLRQALPDIANVPDQSLHPVLVRTGNGDFYDGLAFRFNGPVQVARDGRLGDRLIKSDWNNYAPRIGLAYSPSSEWSIRAGFGVFFSQESKNSIFDMNRAIAGRVAPVIDASGIPSLTYNNYLDASALPARFTPGLTWGADYNLATTYVLQYLFNIQRAIGRNSTFEVGYTGNQGRKLQYLINPNAALPGSRFCVVQAHQELAKRDAAGEDLGDLIVKPGVVEAEDEGDDATADAAVAAAQDEAEGGDSPAGKVPEAEAETPVAVSEEAESAT